MEEIENIKKSTEIIEQGDIKKRRKITWRIVVIISIIIISAILTIIKYYNPQFPYVWIFIIGGSVLVIGVILFFSFNISNWLKKLSKDKETLEQQKLPSKEEIENELSLFIFKRMNHVKKILEILPFNIGNNYILCYKLELYLEEKDMGKKVWVIINASYLEREFGFISGDSSYQIVKRVANGISSSPEASPITEEHEDIEPATGKIHKYKKTTPSKKEEIKKKESEQIS